MYILPMKNTARPQRPLVKDFPRVTVYLSPEDKARLTAAALLRQESASNLLMEAFRAYYNRELNEKERQAVEALIAQRPGA